MCYTYEAYFRTHEYYFASGYITILYTLYDLHGVG
jgi:hypothetical protein